MLKIGSMIIIAAVVTLGLVFVLVGCSSDEVEASKGKSPFFKYKMKDIDGNDVKLGKYKGNVLLVVNTASKCGYTPQYEGMEAVYNKYKDKGFYVLGFPANNFGGQEPGTESEIKEFCTTKYKVTFPMFAKISVLGADQDPLYTFLTSKEQNPDFAGDIKWNFTKFLVDRNGKVVARFGSKEKPDSEAVTQAIEKYLAEK
jgi:glutathione peroxidase